MNERIVGFILRRERLARDWSQDGLCRGICAVSYLSKIERGSVIASKDILRRLFERMDIPWHSADSDTGEAIESLYELLFSGDFDGFEERSAQLEEMEHGPFAADAMLLGRFTGERGEPLDLEMEPLLDTRQLALQRMLQGRSEEAIRLMPGAFSYYWAGAAAYESGSSYTAAVEYLQKGYDLAAHNGSAHLMLMCSLLAGNCYGNQLDIVNMNAHYAVASRLARALGRKRCLREIRYNSASVCIETGRYDEAYAYFSSIEEPGMMELHKLSICCEKLGKREQALEAVQCAVMMESEYPETELGRLMCRIVQFRLENADYLKCAEYGEMLLGCFERCRASLPVGYASFHLPWVLEWYTASRKYKQAYELIRDFPIKMK